MESSWNWHSLRQTVAVITEQGTSAYALEGAGKRSTILDVYNVTQEMFLHPVHASIGRRDILRATQGQPHQYFIEGIQSDGDPTVNLVAVPDGVYTINFTMVVPQTDSPTDEAEILMDEWPIILGAYAKAVSERGEDSGKTSGEAIAAYKLAVADAISLDANRAQFEQVWYV
jgi:hypothetical protein